MKLTRREFAFSIATATALSSLEAAPQPLPQIQNVLSSIGKIRHVHLELGPGPWQRAKLNHLIASVTEALNLDRAESLTSLGANFSELMYPRDFALTLRCECGARLVVRASRPHRGGTELTLRGELGSALVLL